MAWLEFEFYLKITEQSIYFIIWKVASSESIETESIANDSFIIYFVIIVSVCYLSSFQYSFHYLSFISDSSELIRRGKVIPVEDEV